MELVEHGSLDDLIEEQRQIPEARALQTGIEVRKVCAPLTRRV